MADGTVERTRLIAVDDAEALAELSVRNRTFKARWDPIRPDEFYTAAGQRERIEQWLAGRERGTCEPRVILADDGRVAGQITLGNIVHGPFLSGGIGYWVAEEHNGKGFATAAVAEIKANAFDHLHLHRVEAQTLQDNVASQRVLRRNGFERIGLAPAYLRIAGRWQDHVLFQVINSAWHED